MVHSQVCKVTDTRLIITLPTAFKNKQVLVATDDKVVEVDKNAMMKLAAKDPLFLSDMKEVYDDFEGIENETIWKSKMWSIYRANLEPVIGSEQGKSRPVVVISEDELCNLLEV